MLLISANDTIIKLSSESLSVGQILLIRGLIATVLFSGFIMISRGSLMPAYLVNPWNLARAGSETAATLVFVTALSLLPIAIVSALVWTAPIFLTLLAMIFMAERVNLGRWLAVFAGFLGVLLVTSPWQSAAGWLLLLPLGTAVLVTIRDVLTRKVGSGIDSVYIMLPTLMMVTLAGAVLCLFDWRPISLTQVGWLTLSAVLMSGGFYCHIHAVRIGELSFISPFAYTGILSAIIWGMLIWAEFPTALNYLGIGLIIGAGLFILRRSR